MRISSPAKINLFLEVGERRSDGFHPLRTVFARLALADTLSIAPAPGAASSLQVDFNHDYPLSCRKQLRDSDTNIVMDSWRLLASRFPSILERPVKMTLHKMIPCGAGLGGGSSNAASALIALTRYYRLPLSGARLLDLAAKLGSDVPFFIACHPRSGYRKTPSPVWYAQGKGDSDLKDLVLHIKKPLLIIFWKNFLL